MLCGISMQAGPAIASGALSASAAAGGLLTQQHATNDSQHDIMTAENAEWTLWNVKLNKPIP
eukprot:8583137-Karenia_brevis.AAC.1